MFQSGYGATEYQSILAGLARDMDRRTNLKATATPQVAERVGTIHNQYPMIPAGVKLSLAKMQDINVAFATADKLAKYMAENPEVLKFSKEYEKKKKEGSGGGVWGWIKDRAVDVRDFGYDVVTTPTRITPEPIRADLKAFSRGVFAVGQSAIDLTQNWLAQTAQDTIAYIPGGQTLEERKTQREEQGADGLSGVVNALKATTAYNAITNWGDTGSGFFVGGVAAQKQGERARKYRGEIGGHAWSLGRGTASLFFDPNTTGFNVMSGIVDAIPAIAVQRFGNKVTKSIGSLEDAEDASKIAQNIGKVTNILRGEGALIPKSKLSKEDLLEARQTLGIFGGTIDPTIANKWLQTRQGRRLAERLANANTIDEVRQLVGRNVFAETVYRLRNAKTVEAVQFELVDILGMGGGITRTSVQGAKFLTYPTKQFALRVLDNAILPGSKTVKRGLAMRPKVRRLWLDSRNPLEARDNLNTLDDWLRTVKTPDQRRVQLIDEYTDALFGPQASYAKVQNTVEAVEKALIEGMVANGTDPVAARLKVRGLREWRETLDGTYHSGDSALPSDGGFLQSATLPNGQQYSDAVFGGASLDGDIVKNYIEFPDVDQVKRLTASKLNWLWTKRPTAQSVGMTDDELADYIADQVTRNSDAAVFADSNIRKLAQAGELRILPYILNDLQRKVFKRLHLMTVAHSVRNLTEAQYRIALSSTGDPASLLRHPWEYLTFAAHRKAPGDITGQMWTSVTRKESLAAYRQAVSSEVYQDPGDFLKVFNYGTRSGTFYPIDRVVEFKKNPVAVVKAHGDELGGLFDDPVARLWAAGADPQDIFDWIKTTKEGKEWFRRQQTLHFEIGRPVIDTQTGAQIGIQKVDLANDTNLLLHIEEINSYVRNATAGRADLSEIVSQGKLPQERIPLRTPSGKIEIPLTKADVGQIRVVPVFRGSGRGLRAKVNKLKEPQTRQVYVVAVDDVLGNATVQPLAFLDGNSTDDLRKFLRKEEIAADPNLSRYVMFQPDLTVDPLGGYGRQAKRWDDATSRFFHFLYGKRSKQLDRHPLWAQQYYFWTDRMVTSLTPDDLDTLVDNVLDAAKRKEMTPENYVGGADRWQKILDLQQNPKNLLGTLTLDQLDQVVKAQTLDSLKTVLYDAVDQRNFVQSMAIVAPFANAYLEFYKSLGRMFTVSGGGMRLPNVRSIYKTQQIVYQGQNADWDNDGRGFFYTDPTTGEYKFYYPLSEKINQALYKVDGIQMRVGAPLSGALQGFDFGAGNIGGVKLNPGLGPFASIAATFALENFPLEEELVADMRNFLLPYGTTPLDPASIALQFTPAWLKNLASAWSEDPKSLSSFANTNMEVLGALIASGKYDSSKPEDMQRAIADARRIARPATILRAVGQFLGPSRPDYEYKIEDVFIAEAVKQLREWEEEDYDTAFEKFYDAYGEDFFIYLAGKSTTQVSAQTKYNALGVSTEFGVWEEQNKKYLDQFPEVFGFLAPVSTKLDYYVYSKQFMTGRRRKLTPQEYIEARDFMAVSNLLRLRKKDYGDVLTIAEENALDEYKKELIKQYPGYETYPLDVNKQKNVITQLIQVANLALDDDKKLQENPVVAGLIQYMTARAGALTKLGALRLKSFDAAKAAPLRNELRKTAATIIQDYPEFERIYEQLLQNEIDG